VRPAALAALLVVFAPSLGASVELHVPGAFPSVDAALDAATAGDEIVLAAGVFPLATARDGIDVTIRGAGRALSALDGGGATVLLLTNSTLVLRALTVRNGEDGVNVSEGSAVLDDVRFETCTRDGFELGRESSAVATDVEFVNMGDDGIDLGRDASLRCIRCLVTDNDDDGIEIRLQDFSGPAVTIEVAESRIERNGGVGIQLIDDGDPTARTFHFHDLVIADNVDGGVTWQCCGDSSEDLDGWPGAPSAA
jgi:Right handed beta helix region